MLTHLLLSFTLLGGEWILWILLLLSVLSVAVVLERAQLFFSRRMRCEEQANTKLAAGDLAGLRGLLASERGLEATVLREGLNGAPRGAATAERLMEAALARERLHFEKGLSFLGTLGNNAPFVGLFGTVLGIIRAFDALAAAPLAQSQGTQLVMAGISEALVATAVGLFVALPAVAAFNGYQRWLRRNTLRANAFSHALLALLKARGQEPRIQLVRPAQKAG